MVAEWNITPVWNDSHLAAAARARDTSRRETPSDPAPYRLAIPGPLSHPDISVLLSLLLLTAAVRPDTAHRLPLLAQVYSGKAGQTAVRPPRLDGTIAVDGVLDEPMWREAAILTGFSQYTPVDGVAAADSTEVLVWYSATAMHLGVRAFDTSGTIRSTLAERDRMFNDDNIQFFLSTFNDGRQATFFAVNPLGVQGDGALNESGRGAGCNGFNCATQTREGPDLSQDFVWQSKGRIVPGGYEVEIRIPFKSIRFQQTKTQTWAINILRVVQRSGQEQSWTPAKRGGSSFVAQSGKLEQLTDLSAGLVLDVVPTVTSRVSGAATGAAGAWDYGGGKPEFGGNIRFGITPNLTLNATANPDFSQVESDAGQFAFDPRQAIAFPERRPFFLDGVEQFDTPSGLVYTRRIVQPVIATKVTGKVSGTQLGVMAAVDEEIGSRHGDNPLYGVVRLSRDLGPGSRLGFLWTEQSDGPDRNRVLDLDGRLVVKRIHSFTFQGALAHDEFNGVTRNAPLWSVGYRRDGRAFRARYSLNGIHQDFRTRSGFISRAGIANGIVAHSYTWLRTGKALEAFTAELNLNGTWRYQDLVAGDGMQDRKLHVNFNARFKGGWSAGASILDESFGYDPSIYANYRLLNPDQTLSPFTGVARLPNRDYVLSMNSPALPKVQFNAFVLWGVDENFPEWASGDILFVTAGATFRPTNQVRLNLSYNHQSVNRVTDGSRVLLQIVPRARLEYQISRALQVRLVSQYALERQDSLRDDTRTGLPIVFAGPNGTWTRAAATRDGSLRNDVLLSWFPNPGTVFYMGYGASHLEPENPKLPSRFTRTSDGFFMKFSYLWRVQG